MGRPPRATGWGPARRAAHAAWLLAAAATALCCGAGVLEAAVASPGLPARGAAEGLLLRSPAGATLELIGTAHVSAGDAARVRGAVERRRPEAVILELDPQRLPRLGLSLEGLGPGVVVPPPPAPRAEDDDLAAWDPRRWAAAAAAPLLRALVTLMYNSLAARGMQAGSEFTAAIEAGQACGARIVLADIESVSTIEALLRDVARADPLDFLRRYSAVVAEEVGGLAGADLTPELVEQLKADVLAKGRLMRRFREEVPELYRALVGARDAHLATAVRTEAARGARSLVAVVGLAHVEGIERELGWAREGPGA